MHFLKYSLFVAICFAAAAFAADQAQTPFNSSTISGLGARNIGSAAMSGRVAAIRFAAVWKSYL